MKRRRRIPQVSTNLLREGPVLVGRAELGDNDPSPHNTLSYHNNNLDSFFQSNFAHLQSSKEKNKENLLKRKRP